MSVYLFATESVPCVSPQALHRYQRALQCLLARAPGPASGVRSSEVPEWCQASRDCALGVGGRLGGWRVNSDGYPLLQSGVSYFEYSDLR